MQKFITSYKLVDENDNVCLFGSHIYAESFDEAVEFAKIRGLGEIIDGWGEILEPEEDGTYKTIDMTVSMMFNRNFEVARILHGMIWLANINKDVGQLGDLGLLHEITHFFSGTQQPFKKTKEQLYYMIKEYEENTCGYLPTYSLCRNKTNA